MPVLVRELNFADPTSYRLIVARKFLRMNIMNPVSRTVRLYRSRAEVNYSMYRSTVPVLVCGLKMFHLVEFCVKNQDNSFVDNSIIQLYRNSLPFGYVT